MAVWRLLKALTTLLVTKGMDGWSRVNLRQFVTCRVRQSRNCVFPDRLGVSPVFLAVESVIRTLSVLLGRAARLSQVFMASPSNVLEVWVSTVSWRRLWQCCTLALKVTSLNWVVKRRCVSLCTLSSRPLWPEVTTVSVLLLFMVLTRCPVLRRVLRWDLALRCKSRVLAPRFLTCRSTASGLLTLLGWGRL